MKYISRNKGGVISLVAFEDYLALARHELIARVDGADLLETCRFGLAGPETFHDARLDRFRVVSGVEGGGEMRAFVRLRGPYFDRFFELEYRGVLRLEGDIPAADTDLIVHELRVEGDSLVHEMEFDMSGKIEIVCGGLLFRETIKE